MMIRHWSRKLKRLGQRKAHGFKIFPEDIFLVSYPRSGNTWLRYIFAHILYPNGDWNITNIGNIVPDIHEKWPDNLLQTSPRIIKSHLPFQSSYPNVISLYRDGRDVAISYYDFHRKLLNYDGSFDDFLRMFLSGEMPYGSWQNHVSSWLFENKAPKILALRYEELYNDPLKETMRIGDFFGFNWQVDQIQKAIDQSKLDKIKMDYKIYKYDTHWKKGFRVGVSGKSGTWRSFFSDSQLDLYWSYAGSISMQLGYSKLP